MIINFYDKSVGIQRIAGFKLLGSKRQQSVDRIPMSACLCYAVERRVRALCEVNTHEHIVHVGVTNVDILTTVCRANGLIQNYAVSRYYCRGSNDRISHVEVAHRSSASEDTSDTTRPTLSPLRGDRAFNDIVAQVSLNGVIVRIIRSIEIANETADVLVRSITGLNVCFSVNAADRVDTAVTRNVTDETTCMTCGSRNVGCSIDDNAVNNNACFTVVVNRTTKECAGRTCGVGNTTTKNLNVLNGSSSPTVEPVSDQTRTVGRVSTYHNDVLEGNVLDDTARELLGNERLRLRCICRTNVLDGISLTVESHSAVIYGNRSQRKQRCALCVDVSAELNSLPREGLARVCDQIPILNAVDREGGNRIIIHQISRKTRRHCNRGNEPFSVSRDHMRNGCCRNDLCGNRVVIRSNAGRTVNRTSTLD